MKALSWSIRVVGFLFVVLGIALSLHALTYTNFDPSYGFLKLKQQAIATGWYLPAYYSHVLISALILIIGFFQVSSIGRRWIKPHRVFGYFYVLGILFFAAPGGMIMAMFINRGPWVLTSFVIQGTLWFVFTALAFFRIRNGDVTGHRAWMLRSFALTCAAITLRLYIFIFSPYFNLTQPVSYAVIAWLSWLPNLIIIEVYLNRQRLKASKSVPGYS